MPRPAATAPRQPESAMRARRGRRDHAQAKPARAEAESARLLQALHTTKISASLPSGAVQFLCSARWTARRWAAARMASPLHVCHALRSAAESRSEAAMSPRRQQRSKRHHALQWLVRRKRRADPSANSSQDLRRDTADKRMDALHVWKHCLVASCERSSSSRRAKRHAAASTLSRYASMRCASRASVARKANVPCCSSTNCVVAP
mmetsp:Transcript_54922/g.148010  ORF Transcript_54922/g.148010 Transcript_54922/m.148010 type:complete len:206 (+) Transcript_54922:147-764(+)